MEQMLGNVSYHVMKITHNRYRIDVNGIGYTLDWVTDSDIEILISTLQHIRSVAPLEVLQARKQGICRICKNKISAPIQLSFGQEYAHASCYNKQWDSGLKESNHDHDQGTEDSA